MSEKTRAEKNKAKKKKRPPKKISTRYLQNYALYYLNRYSASSSHLKTILMRRVDRSLKHHDEPSYKDCENMVDDVVARYVDSGILNDETYARSQAIAYRRKGWSKRQTISKLMYKGVDKDMAEEAIKHADTDYFDHDNQYQAELEAAFQYARKKRLSYWGNKERSEDYDGYEKDLARLARRGFSYDVCKTVLASDRLKNIQK